MKVAYLGPKGSFTHSATQEYFSNAELVSYGSIPACIKAVAQGEIPIGVVPIENTIEGTVNLTLDYLYHKADLAILGELVMPISQQLLMKKDRSVELAKLTKVYSHPQALAQSQEFIAEYLPEARVIATDSTSLAAEMVANSHDDSVAAIGPVACGQEYDLEIVKADIQDISHNKTRFWIISNQANLRNDSESIEKASLCFIMPNNLPGALQKALTAFSWRELNLNKIESRPLKTTLGEYFFLIDIVLEANQLPLLANAMEEIQYLGGQVKQFGCYHVHRIKGL
ncbi:prephenate dehydratase [Vagococcus sp. BWB3-3]|uniref:Prephenate dehydratase n=1 Tax=Vagococcus allomyrinae TaxID=2794353 RepID=A0A940P8Q6_9ENTE|nr:prephenate dehydratase [Vagococcus allomyrinae]MBP1041731.1 prephenate dehydratase [Vagococcus allomyrinae]